MHFIRYPKSASHLSLPHQGYREKEQTCLGVTHLWAWEWVCRVGTLLSHALEWGLLLFKGPLSRWPEFRRTGSSRQRFPGQKGASETTFPVSNHMAKPYRTN